ncbi:glycoside hydrolase family 78 protein [Melanomma pulvis-pyrius CBS 109.77]|uniref:Glycoside hydrolase family 78 protein n=1 Tax=Melanomma pulvis-pyrius CBS 109.77 TaxID=1314802 RepID=A0A6A6XHR5_9PLEO|nr:glycoside hydrolase family 78 protein [Melanomma pulvis-pyrius CBS 109.77]
MFRFFLVAAVSASFSSTTLAQNTSWHQYVRAPNTTMVSPSRIITTENNVTNAEALLSTDSSFAILSRELEDSSPSITIDFGLNIVGFPIFTFAGASSNSPGIRVAFSETMQFLGDRSDFTRSDNGQKITDGTDQHAVPAEPSTWTDTRGCQAENPNKVCADGLHGFRYMRIWLDALDADAPLVAANGEVRIQSVQLNYTAFLGTPQTFQGWFECEDEDLNQYWYDAAYTNDMNVDLFLTDYIDARESDSPFLEGKPVLFDGAKRDRDPYVGDLAVAGRTLYLTHPAAAAAARNVLLDLAQHQREDGWIPPASIRSYTLPLFDYPLWWVMTSYDYVLYTGDVDYLAEVYPVLVKVLDTYYPSVTDNTTGLLFRGDETGTGGYGDYAFLPRSGPVAYYNTLYILALKSVADMADWAGKTEGANWRDRANTVTTALNNNLWDQTAGAYLDSTVGPVRHAQDGNSIAILSGAAPSDRAQSALGYLDKNMRQGYGNAFYDAMGDALDPSAGFSTRVYAFISYFEISARFEANLTDGAIEQIKRMYGWMATNDPQVTMWEGIGADGSLYEGGFTSCAHGWSTGVLPALSNYVLGVKPTRTGFAEFSVKPNIPEGVTWARGVVPSPLGDVGVDWKVDGNGFNLKLTAPKGSKATVSVPAAEKGTVGVDEQVVWENGENIEGAGKESSIAVK